MLNSHICSFFQKIVKISKSSGELPIPPACINTSFVFCIKFASAQCIVKYLQLVHISISTHDLKHAVMCCLAPMFCLSRYLIVEFWCLFCSVRVLGGTMFETASAQYSYLIYEEINNVTYNIYTTYSTTIHYCTYYYGQYSTYTIHYLHFLFFN